VSDGGDEAAITGTTRRERAASPRGHLGGSDSRAAEARETGIIWAHLLPLGRRVNVPPHALA
jgi:hypothetical protein